jgi:hypothetical protein
MANSWGGEGRNRGKQTSGNVFSCQPAKVSLSKESGKGVCSQ